MPKIIDLTGKRFGRLVVTHQRGVRHSQKLWACKCDCGNTTSVISSSLRRGETKSCGCIAIEGLVKRSTTHGMTDSPEFSSWRSMHRRCSEPKFIGYENYGGRGISVCDRWIDFSNFYEDMGARPSLKHSIDRIDNHGNYEPSNCKWSTAKEQANNRRPRKKSKDYKQCRT
jgi:hypothetical protein